MGLSAYIVYLGIFKRGNGERSQLGDIYNAGLMGGEAFIAYVNANLTLADVILLAIGVVTPLYLCALLHFCQHQLGDAAVFVAGNDNLCGNTVELILEQGTVGVLNGIDGLNGNVGEYGLLVLDEVAAPFAFMNSGSSFAPGKRSPT